MVVELAEAFACGHPLADLGGYLGSVSSRAASLCHVSALARVLRRKTLCS